LAIAIVFQYRLDYSHHARHLTISVSIDLSRGPKHIQSNYSALLAESLRIQTAIKVLWGMNGFPSKAPWIASITEREFFFNRRDIPSNAAKNLRSIPASKVSWDFLLDFCQWRSKSVQ